MIMQTVILISTLFQYFVGDNPPKIGKSQIILKFITDIFEMRVSPISFLIKCFSFKCTKRQVTAIQPQCFAYCFSVQINIEMYIIVMKKLALKSIKTNLLQNAFSLIVIVFQQNLPCIIILKIIFSKSAKKCELIFQRVLQGCKMNIFRYTRTCANMCKKSKLPFCGISTLENVKIDYLF